MYCRAPEHFGIARSTVGDTALVCSVSPDIGVGFPWLYGYQQLSKCLVEGPLAMKVQVVDELAEITEDNADVVIFGNSC